MGMGIQIIHHLRIIIFVILFFFLGFFFVFFLLKLDHLPPPFFLSSFFPLPFTPFLFTSFFKNLQNQKEKKTKGYYYIYAYYDAVPPKDP